MSALTGLAWGTALRAWALTRLCFYLCGPSLSLAMVTSSAGLLTCYFLVNVPLSRGTLLFSLIFLGLCWPGLVPCFLFVATLPNYPAGCGGGVRAECSAVAPFVAFGMTFAGVAFLYLPFGLLVLFSTFLGHHLLHRITVS